MRALEALRVRALEAKLLNVESALEAARKRVFELELRHVALMRERDEAQARITALEHKIDDMRMEHAARSGT